MFHISQPPKLCNFQSANYSLSWTDGNETWSTDPKPISDTSQPVQEDIEDEFRANTNYTVTVIISLQNRNITSQTNFSKLSVNSVIYMHHPKIQI